MDKKETNKMDEATEEVIKDEKDLREKADEVMGKISEGAKKAGAKAGDALDQFAEGAKKAGAKAGDVLEDFAEKSKQATVKAGETAGDVMGNILTGVRKVGEKATDSVKIMEIKHEISKIESETKKIVPKISDTVIALYAEKKIKNPELTALCDEIEKNNKRIKEMQAKIELIKTTEGE